MPSSGRYLLSLVAIAALLGGAACAGGGDGMTGGDRPAIPEPVRCPGGTVRVERVFRSSEATPKIVGVNESCERSDGLLHGPTADWHVIDRGSTRLERVYQGQYREGQEVGVWHQWYANGKRRSDRHYLLEGDLVAHIVWHRSGRLRAVYHYWRYERHGVEIYWEESEALSSVRVFDRGALVYTWPTRPLMKMPQ